MSTDDDGLNDGSELIPGQGIRTGAIDVSFGAPREELRTRLGWSKPTREPRFENEDDYRRGPEDAVWLRLRFSEERLIDIEVYAGSLLYSGVELLATDGPTVIATLAELGHASIETRWLGEGVDVPDLFISIATHDDVGGDGDEVEWVITSSDWLPSAR